MGLFQLPKLEVPAVETVQALLVHEIRNGIGQGDYFMTAHRIEATATGPVIAEGRLLTPQDHRALLSALLGANRSHEGGFLPAEIIAHSASQLAWFVPGGVRPMWFRTGTTTLSANVPWPSLILCARQNRLALVAVPTVQRPKSSTRLFHAPLMNVHASTDLCEGSATYPATWTLTDRAEYESVLFETAFSHVNHDHTLRITASKTVSNAQHLRFWQELERSGAGRFPRTALVPLKRTLEQWLSHP